MKTPSYSRDYSTLGEAVAALVEKLSKARDHHAQQDRAGRHQDDRAQQRADQSVLFVGHHALPTPRVVVGSPDATVVSMGPESPSPCVAGAGDVSRELFDSMSLRERQPFRDASERRWAVVVITRPRSMRVIQWTV